MSVFPALFYTSAREIPTLLYTSSLKKVPLSGGEGVPPGLSMPKLTFQHGLKFECDYMRFSWISARAESLSM